jgi:hypothetical protein
MEPVSLTAITTLLAYWGGKAFDKAFDTAAGEFTKDSVKWLKSLFFKADKPTEALEKYEEKPDSVPRQNAIKAAIETGLEDNPEAEAYLLELAKAIEAKGGNNTTISNSKNVNTGNITSGGHTIIGDHNSI